MNPNHTHNQRIQRLFQLPQPNPVDGYALIPGPTLHYLSGLSFHLSERPIMLLLSPQATPALVLPEMERGKASEGDLQLECFTYNEDPATWSDAFRKAASCLNLNSASRIGVDALQMRFYEISYLESAVPGLHFQPAQETLTRLRLEKDADEIESIARAVKIAEAALESTLPFIHAGVTEREVTAELIVQLLRNGSDPEPAFSPIVAFGENAANPHAVPGDRMARQGDLILIDWGARYHGYISDLTRTFSLGSPQPEWKTIADIVARANQAGVAACQPGKSAEAVDQAARQVIETSGYGEQFFHRTGHGIGLESHEEPSIRSGNITTLTPGMVFTIEPGIYFAGRGGVRIEDNVVITASGVRTLSSLDRSLRVVG